MKSRSTTKPKQCTSRPGTHREGGGSVAGRCEIAPKPATLRDMRWRARLRPRKAQPPASGPPIAILDAAMAAGSFRVAGLRCHRARRRANLGWAAAQGSTAQPISRRPIWGRPQGTPLQRRGFGTCVVVACSTLARPSSCPTGTRPL
eukprot:1993839-Prymnesium_polylepis.1